MLDEVTVNALADAVVDYNGAMLIVTHDRFLIRGVVEGERVEDSDDENDNIEEPEETRRGAVSVLKGGRLKEQAGVRDFEQSLEKRVAKML